MKGELNQNESTLTTTSAKLSTGKSAPLTRKAKAELLKANDQTVVISDDYEQSAKQRVIETLTSLDSQLHAQESEHARDLVDATLPRFVQARIAQSPKNVARYTDEYLGEVADDLLPKFRQMSEDVDRRMSKASSEIESFISELIG